MKKIIVLFGILLCFDSCGQKKDIQIGDNSIIGTWKLIEEYYGGYDKSGEFYAQWHSVYNGYTYTFKNKVLILTPNPMPCDEGCAFKFKKIKK